MRPSFRPSRAIRAIQMQATLADALHGLDHHHIARASDKIKAPAGMKPLITPHEALSIRQPSGDATALRIAFARYLFWRALLGEKRPTKQTAQACMWRLRALALWHYAVQAHAAGRPLPLKAGKSSREVPAYAVSPAHLPGAKKTGDRRMDAAPSLTRADDGEGDSSDLSDFGDILDLAPDDPLANLDSEAQDSGLLDAEGYDALAFWEQWGDLADLPADQLIDVEKLRALGMQDADFTVAGDVLTFAPLLAVWSGAGLSDLQIAQVIDWAAAGQTADWAGQTLYDDAGIAGTFDIRDPYFYDFLREQSGYLISSGGIAPGIFDYTRRDIAETMWSLLGGDAGPGLSVTAMATYLEGAFAAELAGGTRYSADYRAYMIAVTETARAESFGEFVAMWSLGAKYKVWIVNAGACLICIGNAEAGSIPITQSFPGGFQGPPQHPLCRCAASAAVPDSFTPDDWQSRNPSDLDPLLFNWAGSQWPNVDLSELESVDIPDLDISDFQMAQQADVTRASRKHRAKPTQRILAAYDVATRMLAVAEAAAEQWARTAHVRLPNSERDLYALVRRLRAGHDELPDAREATEHYIVALREGLRRMAREMVKAGKAAKA